METFLGWVFIVGVGWVVVELGSATYDAAAKIVGKIRRKTADLAARYRDQRELSRQQREKLRELNAKARTLQLGILQLAQSPDFRRAAAMAAKADEVPVAFRRRQFQRFRPRLVGHFTACLRLGTDPETLTQSLTELLGHLGVAAFESEYIRIEAERALSVPPVQPVPVSYEEQLQTTHLEHERRVAAIQTLATISADMREQLLEAEENRYQNAVLALGENTE